MDGDETIIRTTTVKRKRSKYDDGWMTEDDFTDVCDSDEENERMEEDNPSDIQRKKERKAKYRAYEAPQKKMTRIQLNRWCTDRMVQWVREVRRHVNFAKAPEKEIGLADLFKERKENSGSYRTVKRSPIRVFEMAAAPREDELWLICRSSRIEGQFSNVYQYSDKSIFELREEMYGGWGRYYRESPVYRTARRMWNSIRGRRLFNDGFTLRSLFGDE